MKDLLAPVLTIASIIPPLIVGSFGHDARPAVLPLAGAGLASPAALQEQSRPGEPPAPPGMKDRPALSDPLIVDAVEDELAADPKVDFNRVLVSSTNGTVLLEGQARDLLSKQRATRLARTVRGVQGVRNAITVPTSDKSGSELAADVETALLLNVATDSYEVDVEADDDGRVILAGEVGSGRERELAERVAASVRGVTLVTNRLDLDLDEIRTDAEVQQEVAEALEWNVRVDHRNLVVTVQDGVVRLRGTVASAAELERAESVAWVMGVRRVDLSDVRILDSDEAWSYAPGDLEPWTDEDVAGAVARMLRHDPLVDAEGVSVEVTDETATLRGTVDSLQAQRAATRATRDVVGVDRVRNRLRIQPTEEWNDGQLADRVRRSMRLDPWVDADGISIAADDGTIVLRGRVADAFSRAHATATAAAIDGVRRVVNRLEADVDGGAFLYDPWVDWWPNESLILTPSASPLIDSEFERELQSDVERQLWWSPFVDADEVVVTAQGSTVTLTGIVDSNSEREAAIENAYEGGAVSVVDRLVVSDGS